MGLDIPKFVGCSHNLPLPLSRKDSGNKYFKTGTEFSCPKRERLRMKGAEEKGSKGPVDPIVLLKRV